MAAQDLAPQNNKVPPVLTFTAVNWSKNPTSYMVVIDSEGDVTYQSTPNSTQQSGNPAEVNFTATAATRDAVFRLAERLHFPSGNKYHHMNPDRPGIETIKLQTQDGVEEMTYRAPGNAVQQQLSSEFGNISATLEYGRRLERMLSSANKGLGVELERMQLQCQRGQLIEMQAVAPIIRNIASLQSLPTEVRDRASSVLQCQH